MVRLRCGVLFDILSLRIPSPMNKAAFFNPSALLSWIFRSNLTVQPGCSVKLKRQFSALQNTRLLICALLVALTLAVFLPITGHPFVVYDDEAYVFRNPNVQDGINADSLAWAFSSMECGNWHPLTWISHELDCQIFGLNAHGHHATSLLIHTLTVLLLFLVLDKMTRSPWRSAFVAALFAIHPLHVESVAWVAERKDVLSAFFWVATIWAYARYAEKPGWKRYGLVALSFALGLMSKPMLVTLPLVLLLLDYWPLGRFKSKVQSRKSLVLEKWPLFAMSAASAFITYRAQDAGGATTYTDMFSFSTRAANALLTVWRYVGKMFWPHDLSVLYPYNSNNIPTLQSALPAGLALIVVTVLLLGMGRRRPYLTVGWLWYLVTLIPVIGLVQVGQQIMADRYTYIPLVGLFIMAAWGMPELIRKGERERGRKGEAERSTFNVQRSTSKGNPKPETRNPKPPNTQHPTPNTFALPLAAVSLVVVVVLAVCARVQVGYWKDSVTLFERAVSVTQDNYLGLCDLALALEDAHRTDDAIERYRQAEKIMPLEVRAHVNAAILLCNQGRYAEAWAEVQTCRRLGFEPNADFVAYLGQRMPEPLE